MQQSLGEVDRPAFGALLERLTPESLGFLVSLRSKPHEMGLSLVQRRQYFNATPKRLGPILSL